MFDLMKSAANSAKNAAFAAGLVFSAVVVALPINQVRAMVPNSFADLVETLQPSVVNISSSKERKTGGGDDFEQMFRDFLERRGGRSAPEGNNPRSSLGSGFIIDPKGIVVTNNHVIEGADEIKVTLSDESEYSATLLGRDERTDLAVLQLEEVGDRVLPATTWGSSEELRIGDWIIAIGNPFGFGGTVTAGIVSAKQREISADPYDSYIQTDAAINRGNSGGPSFNVAGEVVGVNTAIISPTGGSVGIGFAIPSNLAKSITRQIIEFGEVKRGWLGVRIQEVTPDLADGLGLDKPRGALVSSTTKDGPAEAYGIRSRDVIVEFNGRRVPEMRRLPLMVAETGIGEEVDVLVWLDGKELTLSVKLGDLSTANTEVASVNSDTPESTAESDLKKMGLALAPLSDEKKETAGVENGVEVTDVTVSSPFGKKDIQPGDVIVEVDQQKVSSPEQVAELIEKAKDENFKVATLLINRDGDSRWVAVRIDD